MQMLKKLNKEKESEEGLLPNDLDVGVQNLEQVFNYLQDHFGLFQQKMRSQQEVVESVKQEIHNTINMSDKDSVQYFIQDLKSENIDYEKEINLLESIANNHMS